MIILALLGLAAFVGLIFGPQVWINWTMRKHAAERPDMPGTGGELARHLLDDAGLQHVKIEDRAQCAVTIIPRWTRLSVSPKSNFKGKSITAIAVAAHEVAHAIQDRDGYLPLQLRQRLVAKTIMMERIGSIVLMATPLVFATGPKPCRAGMLETCSRTWAFMASTIVIHLVTLPTEFDASFKKALPVLGKLCATRGDEGCAFSPEVPRPFTYVAGALVSLMNCGAVVEDLAVLGRDLHRSHYDPQLIPSPRRSAATIQPL